MSAMETIRLGFLLTGMLGLNGAVLIVVLRPSIRLRSQMPLLVLSIVCLALSVAI